MLSLTTLLRNNRKERFPQLRTAQSLCNAESLHPKEMDDGRLNKVANIIGLTKACSIIRMDASTSTFSEYGAQIC
jgi:hypothetical protein